MVNKIMAVFRIQLNCPISRISIIRAAIGSFSNIDALLRLMILPHRQAPSGSLSASFAHIARVGGCNCWFTSAAVTPDSKPDTIVIVFIRSRRGITADCQTSDEVTICAIGYDFWSLVRTFTLVGSSMSLCWRLCAFITMGGMISSPSRYCDTCRPRVLACNVWATSVLLIPP